MVNSSIFLVLFWVLTSNILIDSISSSKNSILTGLSYPTKYISIIKPRDANSPVLLTSDSLSYPVLNNLFINSGWEMTSPFFFFYTLELNTSFVGKNLKYPIKLVPTIFLSPGRVIN